MSKELLEVWSSPYLGNTVGVVSLIVGLASLIYTVITFIKTKVIEKKIPEVKANVIDVVNFDKMKAEQLSYFEKVIGTLTKSYELSYQMCSKIFRSCYKIKTHEKGLKDEDKKRFEEFCTRIEIIIQNDRYEKEDSMELIEIVTEAQAILNKGEYAI